MNKTSVVFNGNNNSANAGSPQDLLSPTSPPPNHPSNSGAPIQRKSPPTKRRRESPPNQVEAPGEVDSEHSRGDVEEEDTYSVISVSSEEGAETPNYNRDPKIKTKFAPTVNSVNRDFSRQIPVWIVAKRER